MAKKAEFIFVGDADSVIKAAKAAGAAQAKLGNEAKQSGKKIADAQDHAAKSSTKFAKNIENVHGRASKSFKGMAGDAVKMGGAFVAAYASISGAKNAISVTETLAKTTLSLHNNLGLTVKSASEWAAVASTRGVDGKALNQSFGTLSKNILAGSDAFQKLGLSQKEIKGGDFNKILRDTSDGLKAMGPGAERTALSMKLLGKGWQTVVPLIRGGSKAMDEQLKLADKYGVTFKGKTVKSLEDLVKAQRESKFATMGMQVAFGTQLAPALTKAITATSRFVLGIREGTGQGGKFAAKVKDIWQEAKPVVQWFGRAAKSVAEFTANHPALVKLAAGIVGVGVALKGLRFLSAATGFSSLLKAGGVAAGGLKKILTRGGIAAGEAAAANTAESMAARMPASLAARQGRINGSMKSAGKLAGKAFGIAAGLLAISEIAHQLAKGGINPSSKHGGFLGGVVNTLGDIGNAPVNLYGKLLGIKPKGKGDGTGLMGANPALGPYASAGAGFGLSVTSGKRAAGGRTSSGNISYHGSGEAIDMAGAPNKMLAFARALKAKAGPRLAELIHTPMGAGIKDGRPFTYTGKVAADHFDHVHVALDLGRRGPGIGDGIGKGGIENLWTRAGGSPAIANLAASVALAESGGRTDAKNVNSNGSIDRGLWQINSVHGKLSTFDPGANARAAVKISSGGRNWHPWVTYNTGAYRKFLGVAATGGSGGGSRDAIQAHIDANQTKLDHLHDALAGAPAGKAGASRRKAIQAQIRGITSANRGLRGDMRDAPTAADVTAREEKAGSRLFNKVAGPFSGQISKATKRAAGLGSAIEDASTSYGQLERQQGQSDEDLGTAEGRRHRIHEIAALKVAKKLELKQEHARAKALQAAITKTQALLKKEGQARDHAHGAKRAKIVERMKTVQSHLTDLKAELHALGFAIKDTELDIGDLAKEAGDVAGTADSVSTTDKIGDELSLVDLRERAGVYSPEQAQAERQRILGAALGGAYGNLDERQRLDLMGQLRDVQQAAVQAVADNTSALQDLRKSLDDQLAFARSVMATENYQLAKGLADVVSGQIVGHGVAALALVPTGPVARY